MERVEALRKLVDEVEAGYFSAPNFMIGDYRDGHKLVCEFLHRAETCDLVLWERDGDLLLEKAYEGSLDAALALHEAVLPGWDHLICSDGSAGGEAKGPCAVIMPDASADHDNDTHTGSAGSLSRAWLIAILKALVAQEERQTV